MKVTRILIKKELKSAFHSWTLYIGLLLFLIICGFQIWMSESNVFNLGQASMLPVFVTIKWVFIFLIPALAMKTFAEEKKNGTLELLLTKPITTNQLLGGKYFSLLIILILMLVLTTLYYFTIDAFGKVDPGQVFTGYLGLLGLGTSYISISIFASTASRTTIASFLSSFGIILCLQFLFDFLGQTSGNHFLSEFFLYLSTEEHFDSLARGILDTRDIVYFLSLNILFLVMARISIIRTRR